MEFKNRLERDLYFEHYEIFVHEEYMIDDVDDVCVSIMLHPKPIKCKEDITGRIPEASACVKDDNVKAALTELKIAYDKLRTAIEASPRQVKPSLAQRIK